MLWYEILRLPLRCVNLRLLLRLQVVHIDLGFVRKQTIR
jgi:hypothetical protein